MRIAPYCRVSTDSKDQLNSLETQKNFYTLFAQKNGYEIVNMYADEGISGTQLKKRPAFLKLLEDAKCGKFDMVVTKDVSRMARNVVDFLQSMRTLKSMGIPVLFVNSNLSTTDGELILTMLASVAQQESQNTSARIKFSKKLNAEKGKVPNFVYGYDKKNGDYFNLYINEHEAEIVRRIYDMYISNDYGASKIANILNDENIPTKRGCKWTENGILRILKNKLYCGYVINGKQEIEDFLTGKRIDKKKEDWNVIERFDFAIINLETYEKAQRKLQINKEKLVSGERKNCKNVFSTIIKCSECGHYFRQIKKNTKFGNKNIWVCCGRNANGKDFCSNKTVINEVQLINSINEYFIDAIDNKEKFLKRLFYDFCKEYNHSNDNKYSEKLIKNDITKYKNKRTKYIEMYEMDVITKDELKNKTNDINNNIKQLEKKLEILQSSHVKNDNLYTLFKESKQTIYDLLNTDKITNEIVKKFINNINVCNNGDIHIYLKDFSLPDF